MTKIKNLIRFHELANEYLNLQDIYEDVTIDIPEDVVIQVTWHTKGTEVFKSREIPLSDFPGVIEKLRRKIAYKKYKIAENIEK